MQMDRCSGAEGRRTDVSFAGKTSQYCREEKQKGESELLESGSHGEFGCEDLSVIGKRKESAS